MNAKNTQESSIANLKDIPGLDNFINSVVAGVGDGQTIADIRNLEKTHLETVYAIGSNMYKAKEYEKAAELFKFLILHDHKDDKYWFALGSTMKMLGEYGEAISCYGGASLIKFTPQIGILMAECFLKIKDIDGAISALEGAVNFAENEGDEGSKKQAQNMLKAIKSSSNLSG